MSIPAISKVKEEFPGIHLPTLRNLFIIVEAIVLKRTTNLSILKDTVFLILGNTNSEPSSHYKRLIRFFNTAIDKELCALILRFNLQLVKPGRIYTLVLDRTNWKWGSKNINLLVLSYIYQGVSIPLVWQQLDKFGNSDLADRKKLFKKALQHHHLRSAILLADREFIGKEWFNFLTEQGIHFMIRLRSDVYKREINQQGRIRHSKLKRKAMSGRKLSHTPIDIQGNTYTYIIMQNSQEDTEEPLLFFLTDRKTANRRKRLEKYRQRWTLESCFKHLKTNGFNLEDMHFRDNRKIELMMALVTMAYCLSIGVASKKIAQKAIPTKKYANGKIYPVESLFRKGLAEIQRYIFNLWQFFELLAKWLERGEPVLI